MITDKINSFKEEVVQSVISDSPECRVSTISGGIGTGKTLLAGEIRNGIVQNGACHGIIDWVYSPEIKYPTDLFRNISIEMFNVESAGSAGLQNQRFGFPELAFNDEQVVALKDELRNLDDKILSAYTNAFSLKSSCQWANNYVNVRDDEKKSGEFFRSNFEKKSIQRLLLNTYTVSIESMIVDLMNMYYPVTEPDQSFPEFSGKKKIVLMIDGFDAVDASIFMMFGNYLLPYFYEKTFSEFIAYNISFLSPETKVSDYFDFRIVITMRNSFDNTLRGVNKNFLPMIRQIVLENLTQNEFDAVSGYSACPEGVSSEDFYNATFGIPALVFSGTVATQSDYLSIITDEAFTLITRYFDEGSQDILLLLPFLKNPVGRFLHYCPEFNIKPYEIENFLLYNPFLLEKSSPAVVKPEIKYFVREYINNHNRLLYDKLELLSTNIEQVSDIFAKRTDEDIELLEVLAFMPKEYDLRILEDEYSVERLDDLQKRNRNLFLPGTGYILKDEISEKIRTFIENIVPDREIELRELPTNLQNKYAVKQDTLEKQKSSQVKSLDSEKQQLEGEIKKNEVKYKEYQRLMMEIENKLIDKRRLINDNSVTTNLIIGGVSTGLTLLVLIFAIFLPAMTKPEFENSPVYSIQIVLYCVFIVLAVITYFLDTKAYNSYKRKNVSDKVQEEVKSLSSEKNGFVTKMQECKHHIEEQMHRRKEIMEQLHIPQKPRSGKSGRRK